jgi:hypothetical protein
MKALQYRVWDRKDNLIQTERVNPESNFYLVSYWWGRGNRNRNSVSGLTYDLQVARLIEQCRKLGVNYYFMEVPYFAEAKIYQEALGMKPHFIQRTIRELDSKVIFVDTDLSMLKYPELFEAEADLFMINWNEADLDCYDPFQVELPGAILGFDKSSNAGQVLNMITKKMDRNLGLAEDKTLSGLITRRYLNLYTRCIWLPFNYLYMFDQHVYDPKNGKYTHVSTLEEELRDHPVYNPIDIVFTHEDLETGELEDVFASRIGGNRFPRDVYRQLGEKLRCFDYTDKVSFIDYLDYGFNKKQQLQLKPDAREKEDDGVWELRKLLKIPAGLGSGNKLILPSKVPIAKFAQRPNFVTFVNSSDDGQDLISDCKRLGIQLIIVKTTTENLNKGSRLFKYPQIFDTVSIDFMTVNLSVTNNSLGLSKCSDPRVLKTANDNLYFFHNSKIVLQFLQIWYEFTDAFSLGRLTSQHKALEYAFNVSMSVNKLRCFWLPKSFVIGPYIKSSKFKGKTIDNKYPDIEIRQLTRNLQVCGIKPRLEGGEPSKYHKNGSKKAKIYQEKYGNLFL